MGKYAATRGFQNDRKRSKSSDSLTFSGTADSLFGMPTSESQFRFQAFMYGFDPTGIYRGYINSRDSTNYWNDYFRNTGLTWTDVKYPSRMYGYGNEGSTARTGLMMISKNLASLY